MPTLSHTGHDGTSSVGGNHLVADGGHHATPISQTIAGLVTGATYRLAFSWAAAQFVGFSGATTEAWNVTLGGQTRSSTTSTLPSQGFSGWMTQKLTFTYDGTSNVLSFLAVGTPACQPPMLLLDGVSLSAVPEPGMAGILLVGGLGLAAASRRRRANRA